MARNTLMIISLTAFVMLVLAVQAIKDPTNSLLSPSSLPPTSSGSPPGKFVPEEDNHLQKHVFFFDQNQDGIVYPWETFQGFRAIGASIPLSTVSSILINAALSQKTRPGKPPSPLLPIEIKNIHLAKHGSDSGAYDAQGRFVPEKFEETFSKHAHSHPGALKNDELYEMLKANRQPKDIKGWIAAWTEWKILYDLGKDKDGLLQKDTVRAVYDGSLFVQWAKQKGSTHKTALSHQED